MKKIISVLLALVMVLSLATVVFADPVTSGTADTVRGSITVNNLAMENGAPTATIAIYQILKLNSFDFETGSYFYEYVDGAWETFFTSSEEVGKDYIVLNDKGLLEWNGSKDAERVAAFAKAALAYAQENNLQPVKTTAADPAQYTVSGTNSIVFSDLELGYYLVDSSVGALCGLSTSNPNGIINSKNGAPSLQKQVQEDLSLQWGTTNSADIGQEVNFRITIHVHDGAQNYVVHDTMEESLTFQPGSLAVTLQDGSVAHSTPETVAATNYTVVTNATDGCTFQVKFADAFCDSLNTNDRLVITYTAILNEKAEIGNSTAANPANENKVTMTYGDNHRTGEAATTTTTYGFDLVKTDGQNKLLDGSEFKLYDAEVGGNEIPVILVAGATTDDGYNIYRKAMDGETGETVIVVRGKVRVIGLDNGAYYLDETKAPAGFNAITSRQKFTISDNNLDAIIQSGIVSTNSGVQVVNNTGTMLPETGGLGTLLFTVLGGTTALGTGVVLVTKKRMSNIEDEE